MKRISEKLILIFLCFSLSQLYSQDDCKVLIPEISGQYIGDCKKGLANGKGLAIGIDRYEGSFKKGNPEGKGTYTWSNGDVYTGEWSWGKRDGIGEFIQLQEDDTILLSGIWEKGTYKGPVPEKPKVMTVTSIGRYSFQRQGEGNQLTINFYINGSVNAGIEDISIISSSGTQFVNGNSIGLEAIAYPVNCKISYYSWNKMHTSKVFSRFEFKITQSGRWILNIYNN